MDRRESLSCLSRQHLKDTRGVVGAQRPESACLSEIARAAGGTLAAASPHGTAPKFDNLRTHLRRMSRNATKREITAGSATGTPGGKRRADDAEEGEISDGGASRASGASSSMSKLARKAQNGFDIR